MGKQSYYRDVLLLLSLIYLPFQMLCHRVDLQNELLALATRRDGPGKPCKLSLGEQVVSCDPEFGSVTLKNGMMVTADVIIGADGIRSTVSSAARSRLLRIHVDAPL